MIFRTETSEQIICGLEELLCKDYSELYRGIKAFDRDRWDDECAKYIEENLNGSIEKVYLCHLTRTPIKFHRLMPLKELLLSDNYFSEYLADYGVQFCKGKNGNLILLYNDCIVPKEKYEGEILQSRMCNDFCVNGFQFKRGICRYKAGYYENLAKGPEILIHLSELLENSKMLENYKRKSKYYCAVGIVDFADLGFNKKTGSYELVPNCSIKAKEIMYIRNAMQYLRDYIFLSEHTWAEESFANALIYSEAPVEVVKWIELEEPNVATNLR